MTLTARIRLKERELERARAALYRNATAFRQRVHEGLASRGALALGFAGGLLAGWMRGRKQRRPSPKGRVRSAADAARQSLPPHWLGSYLVWPLVLATARDMIVSRRPSRREGEETSNL